VDFFLFSQYGKQTDWSSCACLLGFTFCYSTGNRIPWYPTRVHS